MTFCDECETCAHCLKKGCIPANPDAALLPGSITYGPAPAKVVGMTMFDGRLIVALEDGVYWLDGDRLRPVELAA